jgi:hypothetical protein
MPYLPVGLLQRLPVLFERLPPRLALEGVLKLLDGPPGHLLLLTYPPLDLLQLLRPRE